MSTAARLAAPVSKGDRIGIVTLSAPEPAAQPDAFACGVQALAGLGFEPVVGAHATGRSGYRAGTTDELLDDFHQMIADPSIGAIMCAGGGRNSNRLLSGLDLPLIAGNPKLIVGASDPSLVLNAIAARTGLVTLHGPTLMWDLADPDAPLETAEHFTAMLSGQSAAARIDAPLTWTRPGSAEGPLIAGCLSSLRCLLGTPWEPRWDGAILAVEDAFKPTDLLDQTFTHFRDAGVLDKIAGLIVGKSVGCEPSAGITVGGMIDELCREYGWPLAHGLPYGHTPRKFTLPIGATLRMDSSAEHPLTFVSPWVAAA
ncbi:LD-carboxypeptidase [Streptomyces sp. NPDC085929]|uniref:LD-carboxypeptidase n=1 Tax=Streptomyces sp. NPDC085929 TaxID=3365739 RepID=UPI0037D3D6C1